MKLLFFFLLLSCLHGTAQDKHIPKWKITGILLWVWVWWRSPRCQACRRHIKRHPVTRKVIGMNEPIDGRIVGGDLLRRHGFKPLLGGFDRARGQAAGVHRIEAGKHVGVLHPDPQCAVSAHRMARQPPAFAPRQRAELLVDPANQIARHERFEIAHRGGR